MPNVFAIDQAIGENLRRARVAAGVRAGELALATNMELRTIEDAEAGLHRLRASELFWLCQALTLPLADLFRNITPAEDFRIVLIGEDGQERGHVELQR